MTDRLTEIGNFMTFLNSLKGITNISLFHFPYFNLLQKTRIFVKTLNLKLTMENGNVTFLLRTILLNILGKDQGKLEDMNQEYAAYSIVEIIH